MLRVLLDTNILIDFSLNREPWGTQAERLLLESKDGTRMEGLVASLSLKDTYFHVCKTHSEERARTYVSYLMEACTVVSVGASTCELALGGPEPDFEDGLIEAAARESHADVIISRDSAAFADSTVFKMDPGEFCAFYLDATSYPQQVSEDWGTATLRD